MTATGTVSGEATDTKPLPPMIVVEESGLRAQFAPWGAMGALVLAAGATRLAVHATGNQREVALTVAMVAFTTAVVTAWATRRRMTNRRLRHRFVAALYLGASWLTMVTAHGVTWGAVAALTILGSGLSLLYWREHRINAWPEPVVVEDDVPEVDDNDLYVDRWAANLGGPGKAFAGSALTDQQIIKAGYRYTLHLVPGVEGQSVSGVAGKPALLRSGLQLLPGQEVIVEEHPELPSPTAILTVVTKSQVKVSKEWPGPVGAFDPETGSVNLGPFVDGEGIARWRTYVQDGMFGGYLQGGPGSGKSRTIESIAMALAASQTHPTAVWYGDGQNGASSPMLVEHADFPATTFEAIYNMSQAALRVMRLNAAENRASKLVGFTPTLERPGLLLIVDECHKCLSATENPLLAAATQQAFTTIAREGRKVGVALILASQSVTLDAFGYGLNGNIADTLRSSLLEGNGVILRSKTKNAKQVFNVDIDPRQFPKMPGYAFLADPDEGARSAPYRGYWVTDELATKWPKRITWRTLSARQGNFAGVLYADRRKAAAEQDAEDQRILAEADAGLVIDPVPDTPASLVAAGSGGFGDGIPEVRRVAKFWIREEDERPALHAGHRKVLDAIEAGHCRPRDIQAVTGYSESQVYNLLADLGEEGAGLISKVGYGRYALVEGQVAA